jgi:hypothetical protein
MRFIRGSIRIAVLVVLLLAVLTVRVVTSAAAELAIADRALGEEDLDEAILHYRRAARWYAPGSPYHVTALERLAAIGAQARQQEDTGRALSAYRAIRAAIVSSRSFYTPESARLKTANGHIAELMASQRPPSTDAGKSSEQRRGEYLVLLEARSGPKPFWTWVLLIGFIAWVAAAYAFTVFAIDSQNRFIGREVKRWGTVIVVGFGLFVLGLALA